MDSTSMIHDIREKETGNAQPPRFPQPKSSATGFPEHKKRTRVSAFKKRRQQTQGSEDDSTTTTKQTLSSVSAALDTRMDADETEGPSDKAFYDSERRRIDKENRERLAAMSDEDIAQAQKELLGTIDPSIIQMLLRRANLDERPGGSGLDPFEMDDPASKADTTAAAAAAAAAEKGGDTAIPDAPKEALGGASAEMEATTETSSEPPKFTKKTVSFAAPTVDEDAGDDNDIPDISSAPPLPPPPAPDRAAAADHTHFPSPASLPDLDPSDPDFLSTLHAKYFPNLPADPSKLAWMAPIPTPGSLADRDSPYYPGQDSLAISQLRFDFRGRMLSPRVSRAIPTTKGLHHHGEAPEAAGYTVAELARLARSAVPAQRCIAFQTLGRILFRLGKREWGRGEGSVGMGVYRAVSEGRVLDSLHEAAGVEDGRGHRGSRAYAIEALWLYEKGGWTVRQR